MFLCAFFFFCYFSSLCQFESFFVCFVFVIFENIKNANYTMFHFWRRRINVWYATICVPSITPTLFLFLSLSLRFFMVFLHHAGSLIAVLFVLTPFDLYRKNGKKTQKDESERSEEAAEFHLLFFNPVLFSTHLTSVKYAFNANIFIGKLFSFAQCSIEPDGHFFFALDFLFCLSKMNNFRPYFGQLHFWKT